MPAPLSIARCRDTWTRTDADHLGEFADAPLAVSGQFIDEKQPRRVRHRLDDLGAGFVLGVGLGVHGAHSWFVGNRSFASLAKRALVVNAAFAAHSRQLPEKQANTPRRRTIPPRSERPPPQIGGDHS